MYSKSGQAVPSWECHGDDLARDRNEGRGQGQGQGQVTLLRVNSSCKAVQGTTRSHSGNKDMISSGANFLGALKNVAGKIWSTVIMEEDKDKKVTGRVPGLGTPEHLRKSSRASPALSQIILDAWAMNITGKKSVGRTNTAYCLSECSAEEKWQHGGEREACFHGN